MQEKGLQPDFPPGALAELRALQPAPVALASGVRDQRNLLWCSIDNDDSRDLDQLTYAEPLAGGAVRLLIAVADVDALVKRRTALDDHARTNTTSIYTAGQIFPMLPELLSTDLTSLNLAADRPVLVVDMTVDADGSLSAEEIYPAFVRNRAKLAYNSVAAWLDGQAALPAAIAAAPGLDDNLRLQDKVAHALRTRRIQAGALTFETVESRPVFDGSKLTELREERRNRAKDLIEDCMVAANGVTARFLARKNYPSLRRVVRTPRRWPRIVEVAAAAGFPLPAGPDAKALEGFLDAAKKKDPLRYPDLSLAIIKLMGSGEYVVQFPGQKVAGHFGLAVRDYNHSTAPNRRFPDLITQRLLKAAGHGSPPPYSNQEMSDLARHCTEQEDAVKKVERQVAKCAAALLLQSRIGEVFDAIVTAKADKGTFLRIFRPPTEGKLVAGYEGKDAGDQIRVRLVATDAERGYIDFAAVR